MASQETHSWTLGGLIGAFVDLVLAYFLLCGSAFAFFLLKWFRFVGHCVPCPCKGSFGFKNSRFCVHRVLFEWPSKKICSIQVMAVKRFPFDLVQVKGHSSERTQYDNRVIELEDDASSSSCSASRLPRGNVNDAKGKRVTRRRRRRGNYNCGNVSSVVPLDNLQSSVVDCKTYASINPTSAKATSVNYAEDDQTDYDLDVKTCHSSEFNGSKIVGNEEEIMKDLENALEEEKAACAILYLELEKERASAATAADEAMAMISRLQEEKASMELEMRQYQRMVDAGVAYDEEEMDMLQEILIRREREILVDSNVLA